MPTPYLLPLDSPAATLSIAGGKAANLARLTRAGLPVPGGFIVTTAAYDAFITANNLGMLCTRAVAAVDTTDPASLEAVSAAIRARFGAGRLPNDLTATLREAYLSQEIACMAVAVRSSATTEDLPDLSFAGQQDTFLNIVGEEALFRAIVDCWSSLWTGRAIGYRARNGIQHDHLSLAVVVQTMVEAEAAGVLFTANPLTGRRTESVIDATLGLGEALVSGRVEPDHYIVANRGREIVSKRLGSKLVVIRGISGGGTALETEAAGAAQALQDASIIELAALGKRVEALFGSPQDIEWELAGDGKLWLLQARPITSLYPLPAGCDPYGDLKLLASFGALQGVLDPLTPLGRDTWRAVIAAITRILRYDYTYDTQQVLFVAGERLFINGTGGLRNGFGRRLLRGILGQIEPGISTIVRPLLDDPRLSVTSDRLSFSAIRRIAPFILPVIGRGLLTLARPDAARRSAQQGIEKGIAYFAERAAAAHTLEARLDLLDEVAVVLRRYLLVYLLPRFVPGMAALNRLYRLADPLPGGQELVMQITRGLPHNVTTEMDLALWETARRIQADPLSIDVFREQDSASLAYAYQEGKLPRTAQDAIAAFIERYGMRGLAEIDLGRPRWREAPAPVMSALRSYVQIQDRASAPDVVFAWGARSAEAAIGTLAARLAGQPGGRRKAHLARWYARRVRALAGLRESPKFTIVRVLDLARVALLDSGRELAAAGVLDLPEDIFFMGLADLHELTAGTLTAAPREIVARNRTAYEREGRRKLVPRVLLSDGQVFYEGVSAKETAGENTLTGSPVSPGVAEGVVRVVLDPRGAHLQPGEILVCPGTDPSWTPLFLAARGLVMEVGGLMTHGSVVAREYGIPAVVGVAHATTRLRTGQRIRVDGSSGLIAVLDETT